MDLTSDYFEIFALPQSWDVDLQQLTERYRSLQRQFHPDRFVANSSREQRLAAQSSSLINQAFEALRSPLSRAQYLLKLQGVDYDSHTGITQDTDFLMRQMQLRESLAELPDSDDALAELEAMQDQVERQYLQLQADFASLYSQSDFEQARETVAKMQFFVKLLDEIDQLTEELDQ